MKRNERQITMVRKMSFFFGGNNFTKLNNFMRSITESWIKTVTILVAGCFCMFSALPVFGDEGNMKTNGISTAGKQEVIPGEGLSAVNIPLGLTLLRNIQEYRVGYQNYGDLPAWMPVGWGGHFDYWTGIAYNLSYSTNGRRGILLHSPWKKSKTGRTWVDYKLRLPENKQISFLFGIAMSDEINAKNSDGVTFSAFIFHDNGENTLLNKHYNSFEWMDSEFDLSDYAGKTIVLRLQVEPGPNNSPSCDYSLFGQPRIIVKEDNAITYPAPADAELSHDYKVEVNGHPVDVYRVKVEGEKYKELVNRYGSVSGDYSFIQFDLSNFARIRISSNRNLRGSQILPLANGIENFSTGDNTTEIILTKPQQISFEPDGKNHPLLIFANPIEKGKPEKDTSGVIYFGPGLHKPIGNKIVLGDNSTLYLAGGAILQAGIEVRGKNVSIRGRGIIDGSPWSHKKGPTPDVLNVENSQNVNIEGIVIMNPWHWVIPIRGSEKVNINNVKICGGRWPNDDGIDPCNSRDIQIKDCFIRTIDDCLAPKGIRREWGNVDNVLVENAVLWCEVSRIFLLGHECQAEYMRNLTFRNIDVIHYPRKGIVFLLEPGEEMKLENVIFKDIRINGEYAPEYLAMLRPSIKQYNRIKVPGHIKGIQFENISVYGTVKPNDFKFYLQGVDKQHRVEDVTFSNVQIGGVPLTEISPSISVGGLCDKIRFTAPVFQKLPDEK